MSYADSLWWQRYEAFVVESLPRHLFAVSRLAVDHYPMSIFDVGCGRSQEARRLFPRARDYAGIDRSLSSDVGDPNNTVAGDTVSGDYRRAADLDKAIADLGVFRIWSPRRVSMFVSLFSTELTAPADENLLLYEHLFDLFPRADRALVAGMYYRGRYGQETVEERGGLVSHQSTGALFESAVFEETRLETAAPSRMFGPDVVEVWRLLERR